MKKVKRNIIIAAVLLFVCAAVYLNWSYNNSWGAADPAMVKAEDEKMTSLDTNSEAEPASDYFAQARLTRQTSRDEALDLLETGSFTDSQGAEHDLQGFTIVFTTNCPREELSDTFPAELLSRFGLKVRFSHLSTEDKRLFIKRYVSRIYERSLSLPSENVSKLPKDIVDRALSEIDVRTIDNIRILKNVVRSWISGLAEKSREEAR